MIQINVPIDQLRVSGDNMREDTGDLVELAESIKTYGLLQPLVVVEDRGGYTIVCGHRRLAAARRAGVTELPVVLRELSDDDRLSLMVIENVHRKSLTALEEGHAFQKMMDRGMTQYEVADVIKKSQTYVSFRIKLLTLPEEIQQKVHRGELGLQKAIGYQKEKRDNRPPDDRDPEHKWQVFYIDRLVKWLETGKVDLENEAVVARLKLLRETLDTLVAALESPRAGQRNVPSWIKMCDDCGTVVGYINQCCADHPGSKVCRDCAELRHPDSKAAS